MKISRNTSRSSSFGSSAPRRRRNPLVLPALLLILILAVLLGWLWSRGGEKPQVRVEKPIAAERLGH